MSSNLDKSLAQVIASRPKNNKRRGARRGSAKVALVGSSPNKAAKAVVPRPKVQPVQVKSAVTPATEKIIVSNLPQDVNEAQIKELFATQVGPTKEVTLNFDHAGRSKGVATVTFVKRGDGTKAYQDYNGRLIDGKRRMKVEIVVDPGKAPAPTLSERVAPAPAASSSAQAAPRPKKARVRAPKKKGIKRPKVSAEDLDAEMADYTGNGAVPATVAASV
ncbi:hypothetical protein BU17DRAFT_77653 [Hysterangium stoloniferum]|nr:hypothetical protein BU17DRAFT_77653 [Hysterangium stoloniferum]